MSICNGSTSGSLFFVKYRLIQHYRNTASVTLKPEIALAFAVSPCFQLMTALIDKRMHTICYRRRLQTKYFRLAIDITVVRTYTYIALSHLDAACQLNIVGDIARLVEIQYFGKILST